jgi:hypothetical protein
MANAPIVIEEPKWTKPVQLGINAAIDSAVHEDEREIEEPEIEG